MDDVPANLSFRENVLITCVVSFFFGLAAGVVSYACFLKIGDNLFWLVPGLAAAALMAVLLFLTVNSYRYRQTITITPRSITSRNLARGTVEILWHEVQNVQEDDVKGENIRRAMPGLEIMLSMYTNLPLTNGAMRKSLFAIKGPNDQAIVLRSHLLYPHRLDQLRQAVNRYAPRAGGSGALMLRLNLNN